MFFFFSYRVPFKRVNSTSFNWSPLFIARPPYLRQEGLRRTAPENINATIAEPSSVFAWSRDRAKSGREARLSYLTPILSYSFRAETECGLASLICIPFPLSNDRSSSAAGRTHLYRDNAAQRIHPGRIRALNRSRSLSDFPRASSAADYRGIDL